MLGDRRKTVLGRGLLGRHQGRAAVAGQLFDQHLDL